MKSPSSGGHRLLVWRGRGLRLALLADGSGGLRVVDRAADGRLGADGESELLARFLGELVELMHGPEAVAAGGRRLATALWVAAEVARQELGRGERTEVRVHGSGGELLLEVELAREKLVELAEPLRQEAVRQAERLLGRNGVAWGQVERVIVADRSGGGLPVPPGPVVVTAEELAAGELAVIRHAFWQARPELAELPGVEVGGVAEGGGATFATPTTEVRPTEPLPSLPPELEQQLAGLAQRAAAWLDRMHARDRELVGRLLKEQERARRSGEEGAVVRAVQELEALLFAILGPE